MDEENKQKLINGTLEQKKEWVERQIYELIGIHKAITELEKTKQQCKKIEANSLRTKNFEKGICVLCGDKYEQWEHKPKDFIFLPVVCKTCFELTKKMEIIVEEK